ncbi:MAG: site-2 protease family protein [Candidatus Omnitrophica bacterium]|nr:site-2 protease family protein [Candidatus Omnitrophota bacterium]
MTIHEFAHAWIAFRCGDNTAKIMGRLSLNPLVHIDLIGTIVMPLFLFITSGGRFVFGAAKPVPINYWLLKKPKRDIILIGLAGPSANILTAYIIGLILKFITPNNLMNIILSHLAVISLILGIFNLIPLPPLDGSRIIMGILPPKLLKIYNSIEPYGIIILMIAIILGLYDLIIFPIVNIMINIFGLS